MKVVFALLANDIVENLACKIMLDAHREGSLGLLSGRVPYHISLKQPFSITCLDDLESYFEEFAATLKPITVRFTTLEPWSTRISGERTGAIVLKTEKTKELMDLHMRLNKELESCFGSSPARFDGDEYSFHMTISMSDKTTEECQAVFNKLSPKELNIEVEFNKIGLIYIDGDEITPDNYFCYKRLSLGNS
jgi:2'-5' RNA ligase